MFILFLSIGTLLMFGVMLIAGKNFHIPWWKLLLSSVVLTAAGVLGAYLMFLLENGSWGGKSFFGSIFLPPVMMLAAAKLLKIRQSELLDLCAPAECVMLALLKVDCLRSGCCAGRVIGLSAYTGEPVRFPSQIAEGVNALILMVFLILIVRQDKMSGTAYPLYMILYGVCRFFLNLLRETTPFIWILPAGNFWALVCTALGIIAWFLIQKHKKTDTSSSEGA